MLWVADVAQARQLIALLTVLAAALPVRLTHNRAVAALRFADPARGENEVDRAKRILDTVRVMLDAAGVKQKARLRCAPPLGRLHQRTLRHSSDIGCTRERPLAAIFGHVIEADRVVTDELVI